MSDHNEGKSSIEAHEEAMKVNRFERWMFGEKGSTPPPVPRTIEHEHDDEHVSKEAAVFFKEHPDASTDAEYQKIRQERAMGAGEKEIDVPEGYAAVTFLEADTIVIAPLGSNLRKIALENHIPLYADVATVLNCRGLGLCTSCRVTVDPTDGVTAPTPIEKEHLIRDNPKMRLSCQCEVTGPVKISTKPAREYGKVMANLVRNGALIGVFSLIMICILLMIFFDIVGKWF